MIVGFDLKNIKVRNVIGLLIRCLMKKDYFKLGSDAKIYGKAK